jgi:hypothetical protein
METLPGLATLSAAAIRHFSQGWKNDGTWDDVLHLAARFMETEAVSPDSYESLLAWHHLLLGIGNFKRAGGRILPGAPLAHYEDLDEDLAAPEFFRVPRFGLEVRQNDEWTWFSLKEEIKGLGVATTSTLLAAIWPATQNASDRPKLLPARNYLSPARRLWQETVTAIGST